jgi:hypothetical protein
MVLDMSIFLYYFPFFIFQVLVLVLDRTNVVDNADTDVLLLSIIYYKKQNKQKTKQNNNKK